MPTLDDLSRIAEAPLHTWLGALIVSVIATVLALGIHRVGARIVTRIARPYPLTSVVLRYIDKPSLFVLVILMLEAVWWEAPDTLTFITPLRDAAAIALIGAITWLSVRSAAAIIQAHPLDTADNLQARRSSQIIGTVFLYVDYRMPLAPLREELARIVEAAPEWDRRVQVLQVTDGTERAMQLRALVSSLDSGLNWDLRCRVREGLLDFIQKHYPQYLPRARAEVSAELETGKGEPLDWVPRSTQTPAGSTAAHTAAAPVASRAGRHQAGDPLQQVKEKV